MPNDDFETAFESAVAAVEAGTGETATNDIGRNATILTGDENFTETDDLGASGSEGDSGEDGSTETDTVSQETATEAFDWSEHKNKLVTVKVDGQEMQVPMAEAMDGFMRQADYTRKTQSLAEDRKMAAWAREMQSAIQNDPHGTIKALQGALGLEADVEADIYADLDPELQPMAAQLREQQAQLAHFQRLMEQQQQNQVLEQVKTEIASVRNQFPDFDERKVLPIAAERGLSILDAYKLGKADEFLQAETQRARVAAEAAAKAADVARKREVTARVSQGGSVSGSAGAASATKDMSFDEMLEFNLQSLST